jgi:hypothetical protein
MIAPAAAAAHASTRNRLVIVCIPQLDLKRGSTLHQYGPFNTDSTAHQARGRSPY